MEATHRHFAFCFIKEADDVKGEIKEARTWIGSVGRHRYDRIRRYQVVQVDGAERAGSPRLCC